MTQVFSDTFDLVVPGWVVDLDSFRRWQESDEFPEEGRIWWLCGEVWADMSKEQIFTHIAVKTEITSVLYVLAKTEGLGRVFGDGLCLSNFVAAIAGNPDATFVSHETLNSDRIRLLEGSKGGFTEMQGSPDMVLEVVSQASVQKDYVELRRAYWEAGIREYWLVDVRAERLVFHIFRHTARGYVATRNRQGWIKSAVFGREFKLSVSTSASGQPDYKLEVR